MGFVREISWPEMKSIAENDNSGLRAQWPLATYLYTAGLSAYLQKFNKVKIYKTTYW